MGKLDDKVAVITGGDSGIGRAVAHANGRIQDRRKRSASARHHAADRAIDRDGNTRLESDPPHMGCVDG